MLDDLLRAIRGSGRVGVESLGQLLSASPGGTVRSEGATAADSISGQLALLGLRFSGIESAMRGLAGGGEPAAAALPGSGLLRTAISASQGRASLSSALPQVPLVGAIVRLLSGSEDRAEAALPELVRPPSVRIDAALPSAEQPRFVVAGRDAAGLTRREPATPVTIQVQAMDSRSFLDHSDEIAAAVRQALLNTHSLSDVIGER